MQQRSLKVATTQLTEECENRQPQLRLRACRLYKERRRENVHDVEDWVRAEAESAEKTVVTAAQLDTLADVEPFYFAAPNKKGPTG